MKRYQLLKINYMGKGIEEPRLGRDALVNGLPLQEMRKDCEMRCAAAGAAGHQHCASGNNQRWVGTTGDLGVQLVERYGVDGATFGAHEEFIFGGKHEGFAQVAQNW
jgi:hypothetical protein